MVDSEKETGEEKSEAQIVKGGVKVDVNDVDRDADLDEDFAGGVFRPEGKNIFQKYTAQVAAVLFHPKKFFAALPADGWAEPALFLCASAGIYGFLQALGHSNPLLFFSTFFNGLLYTSVGSVIVWSVFSKGCC